MIKLVCLDLDGTVLDSGKNISDLTINTIEKYRQKGVIFTICTGRAIIEVNHIAGIEKLFPHFKYMITSNGASCVDLTNMQYIFNCSLNPKDLEFLYDQCSNFENMFEVYLNGKVFTKNTELENYKKYISEPFYQMVEDTRVSVKDPVKFAKEHTDQNINMVLTSFLNKKDRDEIYEKGKHWDYEMSMAGEQGLEFNAFNVSKGTGIAILADKLSIKKDEILAMGDSFNDISMREYVGNFVVMNNADPDLKSMADYITKDNDSDGVAHALEKFLA